MWDWLRREGLGELVLPTLMKLATVEGESEPTRRRLPRSALSEAENQVVQAFVDEWLLISKQEKEEPDPKREDPDAVVAVEVAHEALLRQWPPLRKEIEDHRAELRIRGDLERLAQDWDRADRRESYLLRGDRLEEFQRWAASKLDIAQELPLVAEFLDTSSRSDEKALEGYSEAVARRALAVVDEDPEQCLLLALAAIEDYAPTPLAHQALMAALATPAVHRCCAATRTRSGEWPGHPTANASPPVPMTAMAPPASGCRARRGTSCLAWPHGRRDGGGVGAGQPAPGDLLQR